jgi:ribonuclease P protein component
MLPKPYRLTHSKAIQQVLQNGKRYHGAGFSMVVFPLPASTIVPLLKPAQAFRVAFVVSKKVHKSAGGFTSATASF